MHVTYATSAPGLLRKCVSLLLTRLSFRQIDVNDDEAIGILEP